MIIKTHAYPRAALIGNPSDGYFGKTIAFTFSNFRAGVTLYETELLEILPARRDQSRFGSIGELSADVKSYGYYGGVRLLKGAVKKFYDRFAGQPADQYGGRTAAHQPLHDRNFTIRYHTNIPAHLGLAGSSAIITAAILALMKFYRVEIPRQELPALILSVETEELGIGAGLQDRVAQSYRGIVHMDFDRKLLESRGYGEYTPLKPEKLPDFYIAWKTSNSEGSERVHNNLRFRWEQGEPEVIRAMGRFAELTDSFRQCLDTGNFSKADEIINANFDLRRSIMNTSGSNLEMVETARAAGASAKFTGSGGAIIGICPEGDSFIRLKTSLEAIGCRIIRPEIAW